MHKNIDEKPILERLRSAVATVLDPDLASIALDAIDRRDLDLLLSVQNLRTTIVFREQDLDSASVGPVGEDAK